ncbi:MAG: glycosyltransferase family 1 protein [Byssovorax sp.]
MKLAVALGGTDLGRSGIGAYARAILPRLAARAVSEGGKMLAIGTRAELDVYREELSLAAPIVVPGLLQKPGVNALFHLAAAGQIAARAGADVLLLPAANRRTTLLSPIPTVAVVHDLAQFHVKGKYDFARDIYLRHLVVRTLTSATELVAVSDTTRKDMVNVLSLGEGRPGRPPVRVVPNGVDHARFTPPEEADPRVEAARRATGLRTPYLLYTARLEHPGKNHLRLLRAFARSRAAAAHELALAGADWGALPMIEAEIARLGLAGRVRILGFVADAILPGLVAGADAVIMVGLHEGFGLPALEALAAGRAVIASSTGALPEVVGDLGVMCDPHDEASIEGALDRALGDAALRERTRAHGPGRARASSWDATVEGLVAACFAARDRS